jgi:hypothetical protein
MVRLPATDHLRQAIQGKFQCLTTKDMHQIDTSLLRRNSQGSHTECSRMFDVGSSVRPGPGKPRKLEVSNLCSLKKECAKAVVKNSEEFGRQEMPSYGQKKLEYLDR